MNFDTARRLGACLSRDYAGDLFRLLVNYRDISASEAASRLNLHIRTAQVMHLHEVEAFCLQFAE